MTIESILQTVGTTPLVRLDRMGQGLFARIMTKLEMRNPCGSVKDRVGVAMIADAERRGILTHDVGQPRRDRLVPSHTQALAGFALCCLSGTAGITRVR